jgi:hypothetical protein
MVIALATERAIAGLLGIFPPRRTTASCTSGTVIPSLPLPTRRQMLDATTKATAVSNGRENATGTFGSNDSGHSYNTKWNASMAR